MKALRILHLEDSPLDAELIWASLSEGEIDCQIIQVETGSDFTAALEKDCFDLIIADYSLPGFDGISALEIARAKCPNVPFIFVSGTLGEELAIETLKSGATDYVLKQRLERLVPSVVRALREATSRSDRQQAEAALAESEARYRQLVELSPDTVFVQREGKFAFLNSAGAKLFGAVNPEDLIGKPILDFIHPDSREKVKSRMRDILEERKPVPLTEEKFIRLDGTVVDVEVTASPFIYGGKPAALVVAHDITKRKQAEQEIHRLNQNLERRVTELQTLLEVIPIGIAIADDVECKTIKANPALAKQLNISPDANASLSAPDSEQPTSFKVCRDGEEVPPEQLPMQYAAANGVPVMDEELDIVHEDGRVIRLLEYAAPLFDEQGKPRGAVGAFADITERVRAEAERAQLLTRSQQARAEAEAANRMKDEFIAILSHELRTPLNSILGWTTLLRTRSFDSATTARALETIDRNTKSLAKLIDDIMDVSRIVRGKLHLNICPINLVSTIKTAIDSLRPAADAKNIQVELVVDNVDNSVELISGDTYRLQQVIWNLISNALKFTPESGRVEIALERVNSYAQIRVSDTGIGIRAELLPYVFDRFRQADSSITRSHGGLGLGLAIVRHLVEMHGGSVEAQSPGEGLGATFIINLPLAEETRSFEENVSPTTPSSKLLNDIRVLVVDDEPDARELFSIGFERYGAKVTAVATAGEALEALQQLKPNILVSDIAMPGVDGYTLMRQVRALNAEIGGQIPAVALTAYARDEDRRQAILAGFQQHVSKPVNLAELAAIVANLAAKR